MLFTLKIVTIPQFNAWIAHEKTTQNIASGSTQ
jgi:hypothetical protein